MSSRDAQPLEAAWDNYKMRIISDLNPLRKVCYSEVLLASQGLKARGMSYEVKADGDF